MDEDLIEAVSAHITRHVGQPTNVLHELIPTDDVHVDLHVVAPTPSRPFYTVVTSGMSEQPMTLPAEFEGELSPYAELMLCLPEDWKVDATTDERWNWPLKWLRDDDGELYYEGVMVVLPEDGEEAELRPLWDFGMPNAGATMIEYQSGDGTWVPV